MTMAIAVAVLALVWYPWFADRMEHDMRAFLQVYAFYQEVEYANNQTYARSVGDGPLRIPGGLEILVVTASETAHAAVTRPRYGYPRRYCALWIGPMPAQLAATETDPAPTGNTLCDDPVRFEAWMDADIGGR
jgi:hypothetical protein